MSRRGFLSTLTLKWKIHPNRFLLNKRHSPTRIKNGVFVLRLVVPPCFPSGWPMSNAAAVTQALFGGGHSTALLLTTGGLLSCSDLLGRVVINVFDLFLLSCLECFSSTWSGGINAGEATLPGLVATQPCKKTHPAWPTTGPFKRSDLGLVGCWPMERFSETHARWRGPAEWDGKIPCKLKAQQMSERIACPTFCPSFFPNLFAWGGFTRHSSSEGWAWIMAHQRRGLLSLMFIAMGLKCRKSLWECQRSRKEKTSLVAPTILYVQHLKQLRLVPVFSSQLFCLKRTPGVSSSCEAFAISGYFLRSLCAINQTQTNMRGNQSAKGTNSPWESRQMETRRRRAIDSFAQIIPSLALCKPLMRASCSFSLLATWQQPQHSMKAYLGELGHTHIHKESLH